MSTRPYTLYVSHHSPYSIKVLALFGWAGISAHVETCNVLTRQSVLKRLTGQTMVPMLRKGSWGMNDSTRLARFAIERSERALLPAEPGAVALCWLLEEFADEWLTRWFILERWHRPQNRDVVAARVGREIFWSIPVLSEKVGQTVATLIAKKTALAGASPENEDVLMASRDRTLAMLEELFKADIPFLFGHTPMIADFSFYGPLEQYRRDPVGEAIMEGYPQVSQWLDRLKAAELPAPQLERVSAQPEQPARPLEQLSPLLDELMGTYWPLLLQNHAVISSAERPARLEATLAEGAPYICAPSSYASKRLQEVLGLLEVMQKEGVCFEPGSQAHARRARGLDQLLAQEPGRALLARFPALTAHNRPQAF